MGKEAMETPEVKREWMKIRVLLLHPDTLLLAPVLLVAAVLRLHNLAEQSLWYDEYITVAFVRLPGLLECLAAQREWDWHMVPVYHVLQYAWAHLVSSSITGIRLLSVLFGLGAVCGVYACGRLIGGRWCAFIAALCIALSPFHVFHSQAVRCYALVVLLAAFSLYAVLRAARDNRARWWLLNAVCNSLLLWTHILTVFAIPPQALLLLYYHWRKPARFAGWCGWHLLMCAGLAVWILTIEGGTGYPEVAPPDRDDLIEVLYQHDTKYLRSTESVLPPFDEVAHAIPRPVYRMLEIRGEMGTSWRIRLQTWLFRTWAVLIPGALIAAWLRRKKLTPFEQSAIPFLFFWLLLPGCALFVLAQLYLRELVAPRFSIYADIALYLLAGFAIASIRWRIPRTLLSIWLIALLVFQAWIAAFLPVRHGYLQAARYLEEHAAPDSEVLICSFNSHLIMDLYLEETEFEQVKTNNIGHTAEELVRRAAQSGAPLFAVLISVPDHPWHPPEIAGAAEKLEKYLDEQGLPNRHIVFSGLQNIYVFEVIPAKAGAAG
jgi:hypothetical protein